MTKLSLLDRLEQFFRARPNEWIDGRSLAMVAGAYAWRSRASDLRTKRGMTIENRVRGLPGSAVRVSEYRFVPPQEPQQACLLEPDHASEAV